jgi:hypothetical protein
MHRQTTVVIGAADKGNLDEDFGNIHDWLRDTDIEDCRPLFKCLADHYDDGLKAAVVLRHVDGDDVSHELVILHDELLKRYSSPIISEEPSWNEFLYRAGAK